MAPLRFILGILTALTVLCAASTPQNSLCGQSNNLPTDFLQIRQFRLLRAPQQIVHWSYRYLNRSFPLPRYRTPQGKPLPGWHSVKVRTRRFFTNQSARVYYRMRDLQHTSPSPASPSDGSTLRIWPVGTILMLETFKGDGALSLEQAPLAIDCSRKFQPADRLFPQQTLFAGEWCYQRFNAQGKRVPMPGGAAACHQCHQTAFSLTGDLVFTAFPTK